MRPDYDGACIANLIPALDGDRTAEWLPAPVRDAGTVVVLVLDGLGWNELQRRSALMPVMSSLVGDAITTVVPSTTSAALTSITTGCGPGDHGVTGYRMSLDGAVLNTLGWTMSPASPPPEPSAIQPMLPFGGRPVPVVTRAEFFQSGFTLAHLRGTRFIGWKTISSLIEHCRALATQRERLVYAYYDGIDKIAHAHGIDDPFFDAECAFTDRLVGDLLSALPPEAALVVTADHGQVPLDDSRWRLLDPIAGMIDRQAGDGRCRFLHAVPGAEDDLAAAAAELCGDDAWVFPRDDFLHEGWLGPRVREPVRSRIGDVVLCARGTVAFADPDYAHELMLRSGHGSLTPEEMLVPLLGARGG